MTRCTAHLFACVLPTGKAAVTRVEQDLQEFGRGLLLEEEEEQEEASTQSKPRKRKRKQLSSSGEDEEGSEEVEATGSEEAEAAAEQNPRGRMTFDQATNLLASLGKN